MKVIGVIPQRYGGSNRLLVEMNQEDWFNIQGKYSHTNESVSVGNFVNVSKIYRRIKALEENQSELQKVRQQLRAMADLLEPLEGVVGCDPVEAEQKEDQQE